MCEGCAAAAQPAAAAGVHLCASTVACGPLLAAFRRLLFLAQLQLLRVRRNEHQTWFCNAACALPSALLVTLSSCTKTADHSACVASAMQLIDRNLLPRGSLDKAKRRVSDRLGVTSVVVVVLLGRGN